MRDRVIKTISIVILLAFLMSGCANTRQKTPDCRIVTATDLHYLSPTLTDHGDIFRQVMEAGDGKMTEYCDEITDAFLSEIIAIHPEALILTGDLSFNGERESHERLAAKLAEAEAQGVSVLVLPGNHDLNRSAYSYIGESAEPTASVSAEEFREIYAAFGFDEAVAEDEDSLSYVAQVNEKTRVLMLDANTPHDFCSLSEKTLSWVEAQLKAAEKDGQAVLAACHQNLLQHSMFDTGYVLDCAETLLRMLEKHHVPLFLSGHLHLQHIQTKGSVTEIATSALTMGACHYGVLTAENGQLRYEARRVDVEAWAERKGLEDEALLHFANHATAALERRTRVQAEQQLEELGLPAAEVKALSEYAAALNTAYFCGDLREIARLDPDGAMQRAWTESSSLYGFYFASLEIEIGRDHTSWTYP